MGLKSWAQNYWKELRARDIIRYVPSAAYEGYGYSFSYGTPNAEKILPVYDQFAELAYAGNSVVFSCIDRRMSVFSEARFKFRTLSDKRLYGTPALKKLETPWPGGTTGELLSRMEQDVSLAGNTFIRDAGDRLERLRPDLVTIVAALKQDAFGHEIREVLGYYYDPTSVENDREPEYYTVDEVAHWSPIPDPKANYKGMSWLTPVLLEINSDLAMTKYRDSYFRNSATPNLILKYPTKLEENQITFIKNQVQAKHGGPENAFKTMVFDSGADPVLVGAHISDVFSIVQAAGENRIAVASGVPSIVVGLKEGLSAATLANYDSAMKAFANLKMRPNWRGACAALGKLIDVPEGSELWYDTTDVAALQETEKEQAEAFAVKASTAGSLIMQGYTPESVQLAVIAGDMSLLEHTNLYSVQLQPPSNTLQLSNGKVPVAAITAGGEN